MSSSSATVHRHNKYQNTRYQIYTNTLKTVWSNCVIQGTAYQTTNNRTLSVLTVLFCVSACVNVAAFCVNLRPIHVFRNTMMGISTGMNQALIGSNPLATMQGVCAWCVDSREGDPCSLTPPAHWVFKSLHFLKDHFPFHPSSILSKVNVFAKASEDSSQQRGRGTLLLLGTNFWIAQYGERFNFILIQWPTIITEWQETLLAKLRRPSQLTVNRWTDTIPSFSLSRADG